MTVETLIASLHLVTPELILAVGAMVLLMIGVELCGAQCQHLTHPTG